jgi:protein-serine/threonine kinase
LFEIARHSWLSEYSHVVGLITSSTTTPAEIANTTVPSGMLHLRHVSEGFLIVVDRSYDAPSLARSASVREPTTKSHPIRQTVVVGGLSQKPGQVDATEAEKAKAARDTKRRTVQVEYVAPQQTPARTEQIKPLPPADEEIEPEFSTDSFNRTAPVGSMGPPARPAKDQQRAASENVIANSTPYYSSQRPSTGGSMSATARVSSNTYGQPAVGVAKEQAQGRFSQPRLASYPTDEDQPEAPDRRSYMSPDPLSQSQGFPQTVSAVPGGKRTQGHKRSSTLSGLGEKLGFGKRGSIFGTSRNNTDNDESGEKPSKKSKKYPPVSMARPIPNDNSATTSANDLRGSTESSRRTSFSFGRKASRNGDASDQPTAAPENSSKRSSRRFSLLPSFARSSANKDEAAAKKNVDQRPRMAFGRGESRSSSRSTTESNIPVLYDANLDRTVPRKPVPAPTSAPRSQQPIDDYVYVNASDEDDQHNMPIVPPGSSGDEAYDPAQNDMRAQSPVSRPTSSKPGVLHKRRDNRFNEAYEQEGGHSGSSGAARRVMAMFNFRRRAKG